MDPYRELLDENPYDAGRKTTVEASVDVVLDISYEDRGLELIDPLSRAVPTGEIHELMVTDEADPRAGPTVDRVGVIGFAEIVDGGVIAVGDTVLLDDGELGTLVGFDASHMPNHYNVVITGETIDSGIEHGVELGDQVRFERP